MNVNKRGLFLKFSSVEKSTISSWRQPYFLLSFAAYNVLCDSSLLIMRAKYKKPEAFIYFENVIDCEFPARSHTISLNKWLLNTSLHLC